MMSDSRKLTRRERVVRWLIRYLERYDQRLSDSQWEKHEARESVCPE